MKKAVRFVFCVTIVLFLGALLFSEPVVDAPQTKTFELIPENIQTGNSDGETEPVLEKRGFKYIAGSSKTVLKEIPVSIAGAREPEETDEAPPTKLGTGKYRKEYATRQPEEPAASEEIKPREAPEESALMKSIEVPEEQELSRSGGNWFGYLLKKLATLPARKTALAACILAFIIIAAILLSRILTRTSGRKKTRVIEVENNVGKMVNIKIDTYEQFRNTVLKDMENMDKRLGRIEELLRSK